MPAALGRAAACAMLGLHLGMCLLMSASTTTSHTMCGNHRLLQVRARSEQAQDEPASLGERSAQLLLRVQVGTISDVRFQNVTCTAEAGVVVAGSVDSTIEGLVLENVGIELVQQTDYAGAALPTPAHPVTSG